MRDFSFCICFLAAMTIGSAALAEQPEKLLGVSMDYEKEEIAIEVVSTGCTQNKDFRFEVKDNTLTVIRKGRDACKAMPQKVILVYKLKEAGLDRNKPFRISNPFIANHRLASF